MSYAELVAEPKIEAEEVYRLLGARAVLPELRPAAMSPTLEEWRQYNYNYRGELIVPKMVTYDAMRKSPHCVAWVRRIGVVEKTLDDYDYYQIACDCLPAAEAVGNPGSIFNCNSLIGALYARSVEVDNAFHNSDVLIHNTEFNPKTHELSLSSSGKESLGAYVISLLNHTSQHPSIWLGNYLGGHHDVNLLAVSTGQDPATIKRIAERLERRGLVEFESETSLSLSQSYRNFINSFGVG